MYGFVPIEKSGKLKNEFEIANPSTWVFEKNSIQYGGLEDREFTQSMKIEITKLGGRYFNTAQEFLEWMDEE